MLKIYGFFMSTPSNKVHMTANALELEYEYIPINLLEREQKSENFLTLNPLGKVPVIDDDGFILNESNAIVKYLCRKSKSNLYPEEISQQAAVDQWLDISSLHIYQGIMKIVFNRILAPRMGNEPNEKEVEEGQGILDQFLPVVEEQLGKSTYLTGNELSVADICLLNSIDPVDAIKLDLSPYPRLVAWREYLRKQDFYQKVHKFYGEKMQG